MKNLTATLCILAILGCADSTEYCASLVETAKSPEAQSTMRRWVAENIVDGGFSGDPKRVHGAGGRVPGFFYVDTDFDFSKLRFERQGAGQIRLVSLPDKVESVFFGERSRYGMLVRTAGSEEFGVDDDRLVWRDGDVAVVCKERD